MAGAARRLILAGTLLLGLWPGLACAAWNVTAEHGVAAGGDIVNSNINIGATPKQLQELIQGLVQSQAEKQAEAQKQIADLSTKFGVTQGAVVTFLRTLGEKDVPVEELPAKLGEIAERHKALLAQIAAVRSDSPDVQAIKEQAHAAVEHGDHDGAESLLTKAEDAALASAERPLLDAAALRAARGELALTRLDYRTAAGHFATAAGLVPATKPLVRADYLNSEGLADYEAGNYPEAGAALAQALQLREAQLAADDPDLATSLNNLAELYRETGRYAEAEPLYQRAIKIDQKALGPEHPNLARDLNNLAGLYWATGRYAEAEPLFQRALKICEKALGPEHPGLATDLNNLALVYQATGRYAEAEPLVQRTIVIDEKALGPEHPDLARDLNNLALVYHATGRYAEAEPLFQRAIAIDEKALGPKHPNTATIRANLEVLKRVVAGQTAR
jgi:tetratricopeptide (TPR) repeat protein